MLDMATHWYRSSRSFFSLLLTPLACLFGMVTALRRYAYRCGWLKSYKLAVPVIVVGNITVGGTGKTPCVIWLCAFLKNLGFKPGIVSRGVGGKQPRMPHQVCLDDSPSLVGDEALLLIKRTSCPLVIGVDRPACAQMLVNELECDIVISDDGLQHYQLARDLEIVMIDGVRQMGNGCLLPAGPLREPISRLKKVDFVVVNGETTQYHRMDLEPLCLVSVKGGREVLLNDFLTKKIHAIAGIGHPQRFFDQLKILGFEIDVHTFPDHYLYQPEDFHFIERKPLIMTEKDAVKCQAFAHEDYWFLRVAARMEVGFERALYAKLKTLGGLNETTLHKPAALSALASPCLRDDV